MRSKLGNKGWRRAVFVSSAYEVWVVCKAHIPLGYVTLFKILMPVDCVVVPSGKIRCIRN